MSLKAYKAAVKVGTRMLVTDHWNKRVIGRTRVVVKVQGNSFAYVDEGGDNVKCWSPFPKSSELKFANGIADIMLADGKRFWTLQLLESTK